jgi:uncharacterized protein YuzE
MERVNITIGPMSFERADYDAENDVLYLHVDEPQAGEGEETPEGHVVRYEPGTSRIVGLTIPETVQTTAEDLAPALAAVWPTVID